LIRRALVLLADHELNASTFTVRCAASTGLNLYDAMIAGLVALKGPSTAAPACWRRSSSRRWSIATSPR
jgi:citrate synthase